jgi:hypothetical protein
MAKDIWSFVCNVFGVHWVMPENSAALHLLGIFWKNVYLLCDPMIFVVYWLQRKHMYLMFVN